MRIKITHQAKRTAWQRKIEAYRISGLTSSEFCRKNKVTRPVFQYWLRKIPLHNPGQPVSFVELPPSTPSIQVVRPATYEVTFPSGLKLAFEHDVNPGKLIELIHTLREASC
jgi:hypothetical protein